MEAEKLKPQILATIDDLNQYLNGNVTALGLIDTLKDTINYIEDYAMTIRENKKMENLNENIGGKIEIEFQDWLDMMYTDKDYPEIETLETVIDYAQDTLRDYRADYTVFESKNRKMENLNEGKKKKASAYMAELAEIDKQSAIVAMEAKINHLQEMADKKNERLKMVSEDENLSELIDSKKKKSMEREIKEIEKAKAKLEKVYEKMSGGKKKEIVDEDKEDMDETYSASTYEEDDSVSEGGYDSNYEEDDSMNEEFLRMQKLAGISLQEAAPVTPQSKFQDIAVYDLYSFARYLIKKDLKDELIDPDLESFRTDYAEMWLKDTPDAKFKGDVRKIANAVNDYFVKAKKQDPNIEKILSGK